MVHWPGSGVLKVLYLLYTKQKGGNTCLCGGIITTTPHSVQVVDNRTRHHSRLLGEVKNVRWKDARTCDILESHIHVIVIHSSDGCIGIYHLLTATLFIVHNSLLPFNLEENGFMKILRASYSLNILSTLKGKRGPRTENTDHNIINRYIN